MGENLEDCVYTEHGMLCSRPRYWMIGVANKTSVYASERLGGFAHAKTSLLALPQHAHHGTMKG
jgi:hypothetical protein